MTTITLPKLETLKANVGKEIAVSGWKEITQTDIDRFGMTTGDAEWIHTDVDQATAGSPYGGTIAQGLLSLCFLATFAKKSLSSETDCICVNYGFNRVRFPAPVRAGQRIRAQLLVASVQRLMGGGRVTWKGTVEIENCEKPACYAELVSQFLYTSLCRPS